MNNWGAAARVVFSPGLLSKGTGGIWGEAGGPDAFPRLWRERVSCLLRAARFPPPPWPEARRPVTGSQSCVCDSLPSREAVNHPLSDFEAADKATRWGCLWLFRPPPHGLRLLLSESDNLAAQDLRIDGRVGVCGLAVRPPLFPQRIRWPDVLSQFLVAVFAPALWCLLN